MGTGKLYQARTQIMSGPGVPTCMMSGAGVLVTDYSTHHTSSVREAAREAGFTLPLEALDSWINWFKCSIESLPFFSSGSIDSFAKLDRKVFKGAPTLVMQLLIFGSVFVFMYSKLKTKYVATSSSFPLFFLRT